MDTVSKSFNRFTNLMDQNIRGVQIGCYSVALVGLTIAIRKVRPFSKFKSPKAVPNHFIKEKRELVGIVKRIEPDGGLLMVEHKPLVNIPFIPSGQLPVKISGIEVNVLGLNWLQAIVAGTEIKFIPVLKDKNFVECKVTLITDPTVKKSKAINVGENLVKIGFAHPESEIKPTVSSDPDFLRYYRRLQYAEEYAERKQLGIKYYIKPTKKALEILYEKLNILYDNLVVFTKKMMKEGPRLTTA